MMGSLISMLYFVFQLGQTLILRLIVYVSKVKVVLVLNMDVRHKYMFVLHFFRKL